MRLAAVLGSTRRAQQPRDESRVSANYLTGADHQVNFTAARVWDVHDERPGGGPPCRCGDAGVVNRRGSA